MSQFTTPLKVEPLDNGKWELLEEFEYKIGSLQSNEVIVIDKGFITNFASVPRIFWSIYPPYSPEYGKAAVLHDGMYDAKLFSRRKCDAILKEAMGVLGASWVTRNIIWSAVRTFGMFTYGKGNTNKVHYVIEV